MKYLAPEEAATFEVSPPTRGAWIEIAVKNFMGNVAESPPTRGAWIEMKTASAIPGALNVAPHTGGVD